MKNPELARIFYEIADILEMQNIDWKPQAYRKAARAIEALSEDVEAIYKKGGIKALEDIRGVGEGLGKKIVEFIETGKIKEHERVMKTIPKGLDELMQVMGIGPKKVTFLYKKLGIKSVKALENAVKKHKLKNLRGFGEKTEENILKSLELYRAGGERQLLGLTLPLANEIVSQLKILKEVNKANYAGSLRRMNETVRDIDILATSSNPEKVIDAFTKLPQVQRVISKGTTRSTVILKSGIQADLRVVEDKSYGAAMQYFTGSKDHNIKLRQIAIKKGYKLSEYGLFKRTGPLVAGKTEEEIYKKLGLPYIEPELRENRGELEAKKLPKLVQLKDIKGEFHFHTKRSTINDFAAAAQKKGYEYIAITNHSKPGLECYRMNEEELLQQVNEIKKLNSRFKNFRILTGTEVDIVEDGSLAFSDDLLKKLDIVVASVHTNLDMAKEAMTKRILKAIENPLVDIIGHPTGRKINEREGYAVDFQKIFRAAKENNVCLEINSQPSRLDLNDVNIRSAVESNVKLVINTDAHSVDQMRFLELGVAQARRGWAEKKDILNTLSLKELPKYFRKIKL